ncbi:MAG TPA: YceI family protein [Chloroflexota bacterium]|nr:YceI family protein [Chloroflexota bacterium]
MSNRPFTCVAGLATTAALAIAVSACGAPSGSQPSSAAPTTSVPATAAPAAPVATAAPLPTAAARPTQAADASAALTSGDAASVRLVLDAASSQASYHAKEQLVGKTLPSEAVGTSPGVTGTLMLGADGSIASEQSTITVDLTKLKSDESRRDNFIKTDTLQTSKFPTATFVAHAVQGLPTPLPTSGQATFQLLGDLTVHGVTRPVTWQVTAQFADQSISGSATTTVNITDFGMTPPKAGPVLSIEDGLGLELAFTATRAA